MKRLLLGATLLVGICGVTMLFVSYISARRSALRAETLLVDMQALHLSSAWADVQKFADANAEWASARQENCKDKDGKDCELVIRLDNRWLAKLHLAPPTNFAVGFTSSHGRVVMLQASIGVHRQIPGTFQNVYAAEVIEELFDPEIGREPFYRIHKLGNNYGKVSLLLVQSWLDERATPDQRRLAYSSLNVSCLYKLGGCKDAEALAPSAWTAGDKAGWRDETNAR